MIIFYDNLKKKTKKKTTLKQTRDLLIKSHNSYYKMSGNVAVVPKLTISLVFLITVQNITCLLQVQESITTPTFWVGHRGGVTFP